jgi:hypothetical protein
VSAIAFAGKESSDADDPNDHSVAEARVGLAGTGRRKRSSAPCATAGSLRSWNYDPAGGAQSLTWYKGAQIVPARNICRAFASTAEACPITRMSAS